MARFLARYRQGQQAEAARASLPSDGKKSAIVTVRCRGNPMLAHLLKNMSPEEHKARGDAADQLWRDIQRAIAVRTLPLEE